MDAYLAMQLTWPWLVRAQSLEELLEGRRCGGKGDRGLGWRGLEMLGKSE